MPFQLGAQPVESPVVDVVRLMVALIASADAGDGDAQHRLGLACFHGQGVEKNLAAARRLQRAAAEQGVVDAQFELSLLLAQGLGGPVDARGARRWEQRAADAGHARACLNRGVRLTRARRPDLAEVARWYERAAKAGSAEAAARLCKMQLAGPGAARKQAAARRWFERAAALGYDWSREAKGSR
ncbi:MAG TPA: hypothetical protein VGL59_21450 [Polyangia bacterium]